MNAQNLNYHMGQANAGKHSRITDPGNAGVIDNRGRSHCFVQLAWTAGSETRTLADPTSDNDELLIYMLTAGGTVTITAASAYDEFGSTTLAFSSVGAFVKLIAVHDAATALAWRVIGSDNVTGPVQNIGTVATFTANVATVVTTYTGTGTFATGANATDRATVGGIYKNPAVIAVTVPSIANDAAENVESVVVDVSAAFAIQPAVGDAVIAIPRAALPTDCLLLNAYVTATDNITVVFGSKLGGAGVTGAAVNFDFLIYDLT